MFLMNNWYVAGWEADLQPGSVIARRFLNLPLVLFRTMSGEIGALEDRCCHRAMPLSSGVVEGEALRCFYHGLEFATNGACTKVPAQDKIPSSARVRSYKLVARNHVLWIWMGDQERADESQIPAYEVHNNPRWAWTPSYFHLQGNWQLLIENLLDLSHLSYVHPRTIGGNPTIHFRAQMATTRTERTVRVERRMPNSMPPPTYVAARGFTGLIDRWQEIEFEPVLIRINTGGCDAGTGAYEGHRDQGFSMSGFHGITPETEGTTHYFWSIATDALANGVPETVFRQTYDTFEEDRAVLEQQQIRLSEDPLRPKVDIVSDAGGNHARRILARLMEAERTQVAAE